jgi:predicted nucleic acid-binding protein
MKIVSNSSPLIALAKIGKLDILTKDVVIPKAVFDEITKPQKEYTEKLHKWGKDKVSGVKNRKAVEYLEILLDRGEAETIVLAEEITANAVLIDDLKARKIATLRGLTVIGTLGVLLAAKDKGLIREVKPLFEELMKKRIRVSKELYNRSLELAHEAER